MIRHWKWKTIWYKNRQVAEQSLASFCATGRKVFGSKFIVGCWMNLWFIKVFFHSHKLLIHFIRIFYVRITNQINFWNLHGMLMIFFFKLIPKYKTYIFAHAFYIIMVAKLLRIFFLDENRIYISRTTDPFINLLVYKIRERHYSHKIKYLSWINTY